MRFTNLGKGGGLEVPTWVECGYNSARVELSSKSLRSQTLAGQQICKLVFFQTSILCQIGFFETAERVLRSYSPQFTS